MKRSFRQWPFVAYCEKWAENENEKSHSQTQTNNFLLDFLVLNISLCRLVWCLSYVGFPTFSCHFELWQNRKWKMNTHKPIGHSRLRSPHYKFSLFYTQWWRRRRRRLHTKHMNSLYDQTLEIASLISTLFSSPLFTLFPSLWGRVVVLLSLKMKIAYDMPFPSMPRQHICPFDWCELYFSR